MSKMKVNTFSVFCGIPVPVTSIKDWCFLLNTSPDRVAGYKHKEVGSLTIEDVITTAERNYTSQHEVVEQRGMYYFVVCWLVRLDTPDMDVDVAQSLSKIHRALESVQTKQTMGLLRQITRTEPQPTICIRYIQKR